VSDDDDEWDEWWALSEKEDREEEEALRIRRVQPLWMRPLQNFVVGTTVYQWFKIVLDSGTLQFRSCGSYQSIEFPDWYEDEYSVLEQLPSENREWEFIEFAMVNGLSPGQPFLVEFRAPTWERTSYEYDEYDVNYHWDIVRRMPKTLLAAGLSWERTLRRIDAYKAADDRQKQHYERLKLKLRKHWTVEVHHWPGRLGLYLIAKIPNMDFSGHLACGIAEKPAIDDGVSLAFKSLLKDFKHKYPDQIGGIERLLGLAQQTLGLQLNQWELLRLDESFR